MNGGLTETDIQNENLIDIPLHAYANRHTAPSNTMYNAPSVDKHNKLKPKPDDCSGNNSIIASDRHMYIPVKILPRAQKF